MTNKMNYPARRGMRVREENRATMEPLNDIRIKGNGYVLANCLVLWAKVYDTREAFEFAMANMALARSYDFRRVNVKNAAKGEQ
jgi:hypothetical protein